MQRSDFICWWDSKTIALESHRSIFDFNVLESELGFEASDLVIAWIPQVSLEEPESIGSIVLEGGRRFLQMRLTRFAQFPYPSPELSCYGHVPSVVGAGEFGHIHMITVNPNICAAWNGG